MDESCYSFPPPTHSSLWILRFSLCRKWWEDLLHFYESSAFNLHHHYRQKISIAFSIHFHSSWELPIDFVTCKGTRNPSVCFDVPSLQVKYKIGQLQILERYTKKSHPWNKNRDYQICKYHIQTHTHTKEGSHIQFRFSRFTFAHFTFFLTATTWSFDSFEYYIEAEVDSQ